MIKALKKRTLRLIFLLCAISLMISCASTAPLPSNITFIEPSPNIPPRLSAFFGIWKGKWYQAQDATLVIERIDSDYADVIFSVGVISVGGLIPENTFYYVRGEVISDYAFGWGTSNGNKFIFEMQDGLNEIKGYFIEGSTGAKIKATMIRAYVEDLSDINIHSYPYVEYNHPLKSNKEFEHDNKFCWREAEKQTVLLSPDIRRFKVWEEVNRCLLDDFGWKLKKNDSPVDIDL